MSMLLDDRRIRYFQPLTGTKHEEHLVNTLFTVNVPLNCSEVMVQALTQNIRYTMDGTNPTAGSGFRLTAGDVPVILPAFGVTLKFISETSGAILQIEYGK